MDRSKDSRPRRGLRATFAATAAVAALGGAPVAAHAATTPNLTTATTYLTNATNLLGGTHYGSSSYADIGLTIDGAYALAAAKTDNAALAKMVAYVQANGNAWTGVGTSYPIGGAIGKEALLAEGVGDNPRSFGGHDLIAALDAAVCKSASTGSDTSCAAKGGYEYSSSTFDQALGILAQLRAGDSTGAASPIAFLESQQQSSGAWPQLIPSTGATDVDSTGMAVMALALVGNSTATAAEKRGISWLAAQQESDGGFPGSSGDSVNSAALALMGLQLQASSYSAQIAKGEQFLAAEQNADGGFRIAAGSGSTASDLRASTQAVSGAVRTSFGALSDKLTG